MAYLNPEINAFHASNFEVVISNIPTLDDPSDIFMYHNFIKSVSLPGYTLTTMDSQWTKENYINPLSRANNDLGDLSITFKVNEYMMNYFLMAQYITMTRYGVNNHADEDFRIKTNVIKAISVNMLDNQKNVLGTVEYNTLWPTSISGLELNYAQSNEVEFTVTFKFQEIFYRIKSKE